MRRDPRGSPAGCHSRTAHASRPCEAACKRRTPSRCSGAGARRYAPPTGLTPAAPRRAAGARGARPQPPRLPVVRIFGLVCRGWGRRRRRVLLGLSDLRRRRNACHLPPRTLGRVLSGPAPPLQRPRLRGAEPALQQQLRTAALAQPTLCDTTMARTSPRSMVAYAWGQTYQLHFRSMVGPSIPFFLPLFLFHFHLHLSFIVPPFILPFHRSIPFHSFFHVLHSVLVPIPFVLPFMRPLRQTSSPCSASAASRPSSGRSSSARATTTLSSPSRCW